MGRLQGKVAIVFGAGPNIGGTIAHFMAREGARIAVADIKLEAATATVEFLTTRGGEAIALAGSATEERDVENIVAATVARFGHVDIAVNMAGTVHWGSVLDMDVGVFRDALASFPTAGLLTTKHAARTMIAGGRRGSIIHILSTAAHFGQPLGAAYCGAKAALMNVARCAAMDLAHHGIRVNTLTPCAMEHQLWTKMSAEVQGGAFEQKPNRPQYSRDAFLKSIPLERFPRASDIANAAVFLASDEASFMTGVDIPVDGGLRFKYPAWTPGAATGVNIADYAATMRRTRYGEETDEPIKGHNKPKG
jgi:NAD(P)-dependent dehydrogenase (short-subunit alcohol dehydrogenase family)